MPKMYEVARVEMPAPKSKLSIFSRAGWWVTKDGRIVKRRLRNLLFGDEVAASNAVASATKPRKKKRRPKVGEWLLKLAN